MSEHNHIKNLVNLGFIVDEKAIPKIETLNEEDFFKLIEALKKENAFIVDDKFIKKLFSEDVKVLSILKKRCMFTVQEYVKDLNERYSFLQNLLVKKLELSDVVSINKIGGSNELTVIGMVKSKAEKDNNLLITIEDPTGEIDSVVSKSLGEKINVDDVLAISGRLGTKSLLIDRLMFPDVSIKPVVFTEDSIKVAFSDKDAKADYHVTTSKVIDSVKKKETTISSPCTFKIGEVTFLFLIGFDPLDALKKRYVKKGEDSFLIDAIPDIVLTDADVNSNYKGISIVSKDKAIDLKTREVQII
jgi:DNA polymerase II small subunit/DNA polymerase delta subunit B